MMPDHDPRRTLPPGDPREVAQVQTGAANLYRSATATSEMVSQALYGERLVAADRADGFTLVQLDHDRYVGWVTDEALAAPIAPSTHRVSVLRTFVFSEPDIKSPPLERVSLNAMVTASATQGKFVQSARGGWIHAGHLSAAGRFETDPVSVAERFIGAPYLWGGRDSIGLDCTGLTQAAFAACGTWLPRDSDMQWQEVGQSIEDWQRPGALKRGDLVFWRGHVGLMCDAETIIHANAHHMAVAREPLVEAVERIAALYDQPIGARRILAP